MDEGQLKSNLHRFAGGGKIELIIGLTVVAASLALTPSEASDVVAELIVLGILPLLHHRKAVALIPLVVLAYLWATDFTNHLLFSGFIFYLSLQYSIAINRRVVATFLSAQWLILAYIIAAENLPSIADIPAFALELIFILIAVTVGHLRFLTSKEKTARLEAQKELESNLRSGVARYLHDSIARALTTISMQAEVAEMETDCAKTSQQLKSISNTANSAVTDLQQLVSNLIDSNTWDGFEILGLWNTASVGETISSTVKLFRESGYLVTCINIDPTIRYPRNFETAFFLAFSETVSNLIKHSPPGGSIQITARESSGTLRVEIKNTLKMGRPNRTASRVGLGLGLKSIEARIDEIGGETAIISTQSTWLVALTLPINLKNKENNID